MSLRLSPNPASENLQLQVTDLDIIEGKVTITIFWEGNVFQENSRG
jgi:hypothetical protein